MNISRRILYTGLLVFVVVATNAFGKDGKGSDYTVTSSTNIDFDSTLIEGKMKSPTGFFLQGRNKQSLSNMVKLRSQFNKELRNSRSAVKAIVR